MDVLCDTLIVEEILPLLPPKDLLRLRAASRRYNALGLRPDFAARYWQRAGVFVQPEEETLPLFLTASAGNNPADLVAFLPRSDDGLIVIAHSTAGLLLCYSYNGENPTRFYVCNPVTRQRAALPELPPLPSNYWCGILTVAGSGKSFQVVAVTSTLQDQMVFSDTGLWEARQVLLSADFHDHYALDGPPILGQSGASYWIERDEDKAVVYNTCMTAATNDAIQVIDLPPRLAGSGRKYRCVGEPLHGRLGLRYAHANAWVFEVWESGTIGFEWERRHQVGIAELMELNPEAAAAFLRKRNENHPAAGGSSHGPFKFKPLGFHPTDEDAVFVAAPGAVFAYSIEHRTLKLLQRTHDCLPIPADVLSYVHPDYPVQIPAIRNSVIRQEPRTKRGSIEALVNGGTEQRKRLRDQACSQD